MHTAAPTTAASWSRVVLKNPHEYVVEAVGQDAGRLVHGLDRQHQLHQGRDRHGEPDRRCQLDHEVLLLEVAEDQEPEHEAEHGRRR